MKTKSISITLMALFFFMLGVQAQSILETTVFEAPKKLVCPTSEWVNIRARPSTSAPKAKNKWGYEMGADNHTLLAVEEENQGWYRIGKDQWISKSVAKPVQPKPITDKMMNRFFGWSAGYDDWGEWTLIEESEKMRIGYSDDDIDAIDNVYISEKPEEAKKFNIEVNSYDGELRCTFTVGMNYTREMKHAQLTDRFINLQLFNDKVLERLFKDKIEKNETDYLYITSDLLSGEYENYELG